ncbi:MAG: T9SS type A sorting domain-containing protein [bacterium]
MKTIIILLSFMAATISCFGQIHLGPGQSYPNIQYAAEANIIQPGDTVYLHSGSYAGYQMVTKLKGKEDNGIVICRFKNDIIDISGTWQFISCEYIKFLNLNFKANTLHPGRLLSIDNGGSCETKSLYITVDSCSFSNTSDPTAITAFKLAGVDNFEVTNCSFKDFPVCDAMDFNVCHNGIIRGNRIQNCLSGGHIKGGSSNITMERNYFINASKESWVAFELGGDTGAEFYCPEDKFEVKNLKFYSNIVMGGYRGLALSSAVDCKVINNTFYNCGQATMRFLTTSTLFPTLSGNQVENNIFAFGASAYFNGGTQTAGAVSFSNNIYYSIMNVTFNGPYWDTPDLDAIKDKNPMNYGSGTKIFATSQSFEFKLIEGSPAIGTGKNEQEPATDFYGNPFSSTARSIGAVEYIDNSAIDELSSSISIVFPNPASSNLNIQTNSSGIQELIICNILGECIFKEAISGKRMVDVSSWSSGTYFVSINNEMRRIIIQH